MTVDFDVAVQSFLYFHGITDCNFEVIEIQLKAVQWRSAVHFMFENSLNAAVLHIMLGPEHDIVSVDLYMKIVIKIASIPEHSEDMIAGVGATQFQVQGVWSKEEDQGLRPSTWEGREAWPSLMMEVGYLEMIGLLHIDVEWWLLYSEGQTQFVIIEKIHRNPFHFHIECWMMGPPMAGIGDLWISKCIQDFNIDSAGAVTSPLGSTEL
ncbi:hypothetical protein L873DRAFT_1862119 [Choiromyces venosus 120613-1]|uniref:Uncharacterized protein n=1 Tax=Choiromyces venosus 120613-1 TaxID=1336337 RepID=A0A3N4J268_9PEZI|nr:hypothetical protein L873DRAFT_1862119 [Choiromyces venosus 120613-1]